MARHDLKAEIKKKKSPFFFTFRKFFFSRKQVISIFNAKLDFRTYFIFLQRITCYPISPYFLDIL